LTQIGGETFCACDCMITDTFSMNPFMERRGIDRIAGYFMSEYRSVMRNFFYTIPTLNKLKRLNIFSRNVISFLLLSFLIYVIFSAFNIYSFSHVNELTNADAAVILGASIWNDKPSPVFQERINHGIWLYKNAYVKYLIFTGGTGKNSNFSEAFVAMNYALNNSVPIEKIFIEEKSRITLENLFYAKNIIKDNNFTKIIIVSDPLHMKRAVTMARDLNLNVYSSPTPTTKYISLKAKLNFLLYELLYYIFYELYKHSFVIFLYSILLELLFT
jgi:uncharacterized SAM-binding protein YcdF (DUF218 family)